VRSTVSFGGGRSPLALDVEDTGREVLLMSSLEGRKR
jgi:hypothetical protein